jgi:hypothetical protein
MSREAREQAVKGLGWWGDSFALLERSGRFPAG